MIDALKPVLEPTAEPFREAVNSLFYTLFENVNSADAVDMLTQKVGENLNKVDDGTKIVGLAAKSGMDGEPLDNSLDSIVNDMNKMVADSTPMPGLPTEVGMEGLPEGGGMPAETDEMGGSFEDFEQGVPFDTPPEPMDVPEDLAAPDDLGDEEVTDEEI
jgi:hypothetical protein